MEIALKEVSGSFHPLQMTFTRFLAGGLFLIPFAVRTLKKKRASLNWKDLPGFLLLGFVGMVLSMSIYQMSVKAVSYTHLFSEFSKIKATDKFFIPLN